MKIKSEAEVQLPDYVTHNRDRFHFTCCEPTLPGGPGCCVTSPVLSLCCQCVNPAALREPPTTFMHPLQPAYVPSTFENTLAQNMSESTTRIYAFIDNSSSWHNCLHSSQLQVPSLNHLSWPYASLNDTLKLL